MRNFTTRLLELEASHADQVILNLLKTGDEDFHLTYAQLMREARKVAMELAEQGIQPGEVVILILQQGLDLIYAYFGAILNGSIPSIMPFLTEKLLPEKYRKDLESLFEITHPCAVITYQDFSNELELIRAGSKYIRSIIYIEGMNKSDDSIFPNELPGATRGEEDIVLLQHSSGSTGLQKGVALSHRAIFNQLDSYLEAMRVTDRDVIVSWLPLYHDMGLIACFLMPILYNIPLVLMSPFDWVKAPYRLFKAISSYKGTLCWLPNFAYNFCAQKVREDDLQGVDLSTLRAVVNCSEPMRYHSHMLFLDRYKGYGLQSSALTTCYAMAENVFAVSQGGVEKPVAYDEIDLEKFQRDGHAVQAAQGKKTVLMVSAGRPITNTFVKIIDAEARELPERHLGEIAIKSNCMLSEYYHRSDATQSALIDGWFKTGDLGYLANGEVFISGRKKDLIIVGGKNVYPQDVEFAVNTVEGIHPGRVVAFGVFNEDKGTEDVVVVAEIETGYDDRMREVAENVRKTVNQSTAVALRHVHLVDKIWLIKTSSGKIARSANKDKYLAEFVR